MTKENEINKSRIWLAVCYPENMRENWEDDADEILQLPYAYCVHNRDNLKESKKGDSEQRKTHVHFIVVFKNTTTRNHALSVMNLLSADGKKCCSGVKACLDVRHSYDYLIHDTPNARKKGKHVYDPSERITGNNFDIGAYEQLSQDEKDMMLSELCTYAREKRLRDMAVLYDHLTQYFDWRYFEIYRYGNAMLDRICRGNDAQARRKSKPFEPPKCAFCGTQYVTGHYETEKGTYWFCSDDRCIQAAYTILEGIESGADNQ